MSRVIADRSDQALVIEEADVVAASDGENVFACMFRADTDRVVPPFQGTGAGDEVTARVGRSIDRLARRSRWTGMPTLARGATCGRAVRALLVVIDEEPIELTVELRVAASTRLTAEPLLQGLMEPFDLPAGLGMMRRREDLPDPDIAQVSFEVSLGAVLLKGP
jgi:hypothetical protein